MPWSLSTGEFENHLLYLKKHFSLILPGQRASKSLCITFDDATVDFYYHVFPLLKKHGIKVVLAVCPHYSLETTNLSSDKRLQFTEKKLFTPLSKEKGYFCTFEELKEMQDSTLVKIASHSFSHPNLLKPNINLDKEIAASKTVLEDALKSTIDIFVYPYGKFNTKIRQVARHHYFYQMRIGSGINFGNNHFIYRIPCDSIKSIQCLFSKSKYIIYSLNAALNKIRFR